MRSIFFSAGLAASFLVSGLLSGPTLAESYDAVSYTHLTLPTTSRV